MCVFFQQVGIDLLFNLINKIHFANVSSILLVCLSVAFHRFSKKEFIMSLYVRLAKAPIIGKF